MSVICVQFLQGSAYCSKKFTGDFKVMLPNLKKNEMIIFNDNYKDQNKCIRGSGSAIMRPSSFYEPSKVSGIPTGWEAGHSFKTLGNLEKNIIDCALWKIKLKISKYNIDTIYFPGKNNKIGCKTFDLCNELVDYITKELNNVFIEIEVVNESDILQLEQEINKEMKLREEKMPTMRPIPEKFKREYWETVVPSNNKRQKPETISKLPNKYTLHSRGFPFFEEQDFNKCGILITDSTIEEEYIDCKTTDFQINQYILWKNDIFRIENIRDDGLYDLHQGDDIFESERDDMYCLCEMEDWPNMLIQVKLSNWKRWQQFKQFANKNVIKNAFEVFKNNGITNVENDS